MNNSTHERTETNWQKEYEQMKKHARLWERRSKENLVKAQKLQVLLNASETRRVSLASQVAQLKAQGHTDMTNSLLNRYGTTTPLILLEHSTEQPGVMASKLVKPSDLEPASK